jgi:hypothetical protein
MKIHNVPIYHCLCCGSILHGEMGATPPECCGREMVKAGEQTLHERQVESVKPGLETTCVTLPPQVRAPAKPR